MKEFFETEMKKLHLVGIRQADFLTADEIEEILNALCNVSEKSYKYIPKEVQQAEIKRQIIQDPDFNGLNARWLHKILYRISEKYWKDKMKTEQTEEAQGEPISQERAEYWIGEWNKVISKAHENLTKGQGTGSQLKESLNQLASPAGRPFKVGQVCPQCNGDGTKEGQDNIIEMCETCKGEGEINQKEVWAQDEGEAKIKYNKDA